METYISPIIAFLMTWFGISSLRQIALKLDLVDKPGGRKCHQGNIPLVGGIAMFCGFSFAILTLSISLSQYRSLLAAALLLVIAGVLDDFHEFSAKKKFVAQIIAVSLIIIWGNNTLHHLGDIFFTGQLELVYFAIPVTLFALVGLINAVNMIDGLDGLAGGVSFIQFLFLFVLAMLSKHYLDAELISLMLSVLLAFLIFNLPWAPARVKIFMGDAGSMFLGLMLGWFCVKLSQGQHPAASPVTMLWIMAMPLLDSLTAIIRRLLKGLSPFYPDKAHFHHVFTQAGYSQAQTLGVIYTLSIVCGLIGVLGHYYHWSQGILFIGFLVLFMIYLHFVRHAWRVMRVIKRHRLQKD